MKLFILVLVIVLAVAAPALAAPGEPRLVQGTLEWPQSLAQTPLPVIIVRGDDGALYYANIAAAERRGAPTAGSKIAILGLEGKRANEVVAMLVTPNNPADRAPSVVAVPAAAVPSASAPVSAAPRSAPADASRRWSEIQGVVQAVGRNTIVLKGDDGQRIVVDVSALGSGLGEGATVGSVVKLYGVPTEQRFKASGFVDNGSRRQ